MSCKDQSGSLQFIQISSEKQAFVGHSCPYLCIALVKTNMINIFSFFSTTNVCMIAQMQF